VANPFTYLGQFGVLDSGRGLSFLGNRWYSAALGRFVTTDPIGIEGGINLYEYANNNPIALSDPLGLEPAPNGQQILQNGTEQQTNQYLNEGLPRPQAPQNVNLSVSYNWPNGAGGTVGITIENNGNVRTTSGPSHGTPGRGFSVTPSTSPATTGWTTQTSGGAGVGVSTSTDDKGNSSTDIQLTTPGASVARVYTSDPINSYFTIPKPQPFANIAGPRAAAKFDDSEYWQFVNDTGLTVRRRRPNDPNEVTGPAGFGTQGFVQSAGVLPYRVDFTNEPSALAAAATVVVTDQLSANLDLNTFQLGELGFGSTVVQVPAGLASYSTELTLLSTAPGTGPDGLIVQISASLDPATGLVTWTLTSLDPTTLDIASDPLEGLLPPDDSAGDGEGFVTYTVEPKSSATTGTAIKAQATVVFDTNAPINTKSISNTIDTTVPTSAVAALPATTTTPSFTVSWSGSDGKGSGIATYNVFVSTNGGPFQPFQTRTTATSANFTGQVGNTYAFYSVAISNVGLVQPTPTAAQATTRVVKATPVPAVIVTSVHWGTIQVKTGSGKNAKTKSETALEIHFSGLVSGAANVGAYRISSVTTKTVKKKTVTTLKPIVLSSVVPSSSPSTTSVALVPTGKINLAQTDQLVIIAADITDAQRRALDGNHDGKPGGNFVGTFSRNGLTVARPSAILREPRLSATAIDVVLRHEGFRRRVR